MGNLVIKSVTRSEHLMTQALFREIADRAWYYQAGIPTRSVTPSHAALAQLASLAESAIPDQSTSAEEVLKILDQYVAPATIASTGGRYFGLVVGGTLPAALAASWLVTAWDQNAAAWVLAPGTTTVEGIAARWVLDLLRLPPTSGLGFVTGSTMAHFVCLAAARNALLAKLGWDVERDGLFAAPPFRVVVSADVHVSVIKALGMLGLGRQRIESVPVDAEGSMCAGKLPPLDNTTLVCIQAGNVHTGAFDPALAICAAAQTADAWVHVDGAFGLWAAASPHYANLLNGVDLANSWAVDAHKWLNVPYDCGMAICRDPVAMKAAMAIDAEYFTCQTAHDPEHFTPEMSRRARGVDVWAAIRSLGRVGIADLIERSCEHAQTFKTRLIQAGFEVLNEVVLNQVLVAFGTDARTERIIRAIQEDGSTWCGGTVWNGRVAMRISISCWRTTAADVDEVITAITRIADSL